MAEEEDPTAGPDEAAIKRRDKALERLTRRHKELQRTLRSSLDTEQELKEHYQELEAQVEKLGDSYEKMAEKEAMLDAIHAQGTKQLQQQQELNRIKIQQQQTILDKLEAEGDGAGKRAEQRRQEIDDLREQNKLVSKKIRLDAQDQVGIKKTSAANKKLADTGKEWAEGLLGIDSKTDSWMKTIGESDHAMGSLVKGIKGGVSAQKILLSVGKKMIEFSIYMAKETLKYNMAIDKTASSFMKATGMSRRYTKDLYALNKEMLESGVMTDELAAAQTAAAQGMTAWGSMVKSTRMEITSMAAISAELGVSTQDSMSIMDTALKSMHLSASDSKDMMAEVYSVADSLSLPFNKVASDFALVSKKLAFYGADVTDVFFRLEKQAKATGISMEGLLGISEQYDTFEGAAVSVGRLNAILGGPYLNSIDMIHMDEEERLETLKRTIKAAGIQFDQMNKYEQLNIAGAIGTDVETARRLLGNMNADDMLRVKTQEDMAKAAKEAQDVITKLKIAFLKLLKVMEPMVDSFHDFADFAIKASDVIKHFTGPVGILTFMFGGLTAQVVGFLWALNKMGKAVQRSGIRMRVIGGRGSPTHRAGTQMARLGTRTRNTTQAARAFFSLKGFKNFFGIGKPGSRLSRMTQFFKDLKTVKIPNAIKDLKSFFGIGKEGSRLSKMTQFFKELKTVKIPKAITDIRDFFKGGKGIMGMFKGGKAMVGGALTGFFKRFAPIGFILAIVEGIVGWVKDLSVVFHSDKLSGLQKVGAIFVTFGLRVIEVCQLFVASFVEFIDMIIGAIDWVSIKVSKIPGMGWLRDDDAEVNWRRTGEATGMGPEQVRDQHALLTQQVAPNLATLGVGEGAGSDFGTRQKAHGEAGTGSGAFNLAPGPLSADSMEEFARQSGRLSKKRAMGGLAVPIISSLMARFAGSLLTVGENGPETVQVPVGSRVSPAGETSDLIGALGSLKDQIMALLDGDNEGAEQRVVVQVGNETFADAMYRAKNSWSGRRRFGVADT